MASCLTNSMEDHYLSAVRDRLFSIFRATLHRWRLYPSSANCGRAMPWLQGPIQHGRNTFHTRNRTPDVKSVISHHNNTSVLIHARCIYSLFLKQVYPFWESTLRSFGITRAFGVLRKKNLSVAVIKFLKTLPTLTTYYTLAHKQGTLTHLGSVKGKILDQIDFGLLQHANSKNWFLENSATRVIQPVQSLQTHISVTKEFSTEVQRSFLPSVTYNSPMEITYFV